MTHDPVSRVQLLVVDDCPNAGPAADLLADVLADLGHPGLEVPVMVVRDQRTAERLRFPGSPTVHVDGEDPFAPVDAAPALACRVYATADGPRGVPDRDALREALRTALPQR